MLRQSPRFGVRSTSIILSLRSKYSLRSAPTGASTGSSHRPLSSSPNCNSVCEQSMPKDSTPRSLAFLILKSPGNFAPITAKGTLMPTRALGAPQTTFAWASPPTTLQTFSLSASGCCSTLIISPTTTPEILGAADSTLSTSRPAIVS